MLSRIQQDDDSVPMRKGDWWYSTRTRHGEQYPIYLRRHAVGAERRFDPDGSDETLLDLNAMVVGKPVLRLGVTAVTRDAMRLAAQKLPIKTKFVTRADQEGGAI